MHIPLANPTHETLVLRMVNSDPSHFTVETDPNQVSKISVLSQKREKRAFFLKQFELCIVLWVQNIQSFKHFKYVF